MAGIGITGMQHVALEVRDLAEAVAFFVDGLGLAEVQRPDFGFPGAWLGLPDGRSIHLIATEHVADPAYHVALAVADVDAAVAALRDRGIKVSDPFDLPSGFGRQTFLHDPTGNLVELNQPAP